MKDKLEAIAAQLAVGLAEMSLRATFGYGSEVPIYREKDKQQQIGCMKMQNVDWNNVAKGTLDLSVDEGPSVQCKALSVCGVTTIEGVFGSCVTLNISVMLGLRESKVGDRYLPIMISVKSSKLPSGWHWSPETNSFSVTDEVADYLVSHFTRNGRLILQKPSNN